VSIDTTALPPTEENLVANYERMAHTYDRGSVDTALRALDVVLSAVALVVLSPVIALTALAVLVAGGRPVLYRGQRVGRAGRVFTMAKFRTLKPDAEQRLGPYLGPELTQLTAGEVSRLGRVLRATKLDELPQLWNVLRGDMSIVGPRPIRPPFFAELCEEIPQYWQRLVVPPGLTGLAQLRLTREMTWAEKLAHDMEYIADRSVGLYFRAIAATVVKVLSDALRSLARTLTGD
jgi:lipopolysaccharide/colanic/teichoic acid biosynthesis glycosyltransferase